LIILKNHVANIREGEKRYSFDPSKGQFADSESVKNIADMSSSELEKANADIAGKLESESVMIQFAVVRPPLHLPAETMPPMQGGYPSPSPTPVPKMPTVTIDGYDYIGSLTVPSLALELPVMADWDYERLKISPCVFSRNYFSDDLVICGHNFPSHFSPLWEIPMGEEVLFTTSDGTVYRYVVSNRETVKPDDVSTMTTNAHSAIPGTGDWDLTLFTCNLGGQTRCAVRCVRSDAG